MTNMSLRCPNCQQIDAVQKVSAIVNGGISSGRFSGYANGYYDNAYINISNYNQTRLSKLLSPPKNPYSVIGHYYPDSVYINWLIGTSIVGLSCLGFLLAIIFTGTSSQFYCLNLLIVLTFLGTLILSFVLFIKLKDSRVNINWARSQWSYWKTAMTRWQQMYYCHRCDGIFLPGENVLIPVK